MAIADANYKFLSIDVGGKGSEGDSNIFGRTTLGRIIKNDETGLNLPPNAVVNGIRLPYYFLGDDAFPLHRIVELNHFLRMEKKTR